MHPRSSKRRTNPYPGALHRKTLMTQHTPSRLTRTIIALALCACALSTAGCVVGAAVGGMIESHRRTSTRPIAAEYTGLAGHNFALLVDVDRQIQANFADLQTYIASQITARLIDPANAVAATGYVPSGAIMEYQFANPSWPAKTYEEIADYFSTPDAPVTRLILIEITEFRLSEPGNAYLWDGRAAARVGVVELDSYAPNEFAYVRDIQVRFPDGEGFGPQDMPASTVYTNLLARTIDRTSWLLYLHEEPYYPDY